MNTALRRSLPEDKYQRLVEAALNRFEQLKNDSERTAHYSNLSRYEKRADGDFSDRQSTHQDPKKPLRAIFLLKNNTLGIVRSVKRFLLAKITRDLFGSEPYIHIKPEGRADKDLALRMQKHAGWKLRLAKYREKIKRVLEQVLDVGYCPVKTTWDVQDDVSERLEMILTHRADGTPVVTRDGDYIYFEDEVTEVGLGGGLGEEVSGQWSEVRSDSEEQMSEIDAPRSQRTAFAKAPEVVMDEERYEWREHLIEEKVRIYNGLRIDPCDRKDVFWQFNVSDLNDSDMVAHQFDSKLSALRRKYAPESFEAKDEAGRMKEEVNGVLGLVDRTRDHPAGSLQETSRSTRFSFADGGSGSELKGGAANDSSEVMRILEGLKNGCNTPKAEATQPRDNEGATNGPENDPTILTVEVSFDYDCFEDGIVRRLHMVLLPDAKTCIYAEYRAALAPQAAKNIHLVAINRPKGRAYGRGLDEVYEAMSDLADELLNAIMRRNEYNSKPKVVWSPHNTIEGKNNAKLNFWDTETVTPDNPQLQPKDIAYPIVLPDLDTRTWELMELFMQLIQLDSGVTNASQGDVSNLPSNSTATGINSMLESSSVLHQFILEEIRDGLTEQLTFAVGLIYLRQDEDETYEYLEGEPGADGVMALADARKLRHMPMNVEILLTRAKQQEQREAALAGIPMGVQFGTLQPADQFRMRDAFVQLFRALNFSNPEEFFPTPEELAMQVAGLLQEAGWVVQPPAGAEEVRDQMSEVSDPAAEPDLPANVIPDGNPTPEAVA